MSFGGWGSDRTRGRSSNGRGEVGVKERREKEEREKRKGGEEGKK